MEELLVFGTFGMEGTMGKGLLQGAPFFQILAGGIREAGFYLPLPNVLYGLVGGVQHIRIVETIVAKLIVHNLVGREVVK